MGGTGGKAEEAGGVIRFVYYVGRLAQLIGMYLLIVDIVMAGPLGPSPKVFAAGVAVFLVGWGLSRLTR
jgi:hypothetical protein